MGQRAACGVALSRHCIAVMWSFVQQIAATVQAVQTLSKRRHGPNGSVGWQTKGSEARLLPFVCTLLTLHCSDVVSCATDCGNRAGCADLKQEAAWAKGQRGGADERL